MRSPILHRNSIPFFYDKSPGEFQKDRYERYDPMVIRQTALHLADHLWGGYPLQPVLDFAQPHLPSSLQNIVELGSSVGRWIGILAKQYPTATCWGIDFSYQLLKRAKEFWVGQKSVQIDTSKLGFTGYENLEGLAVENLNFGLAKASILPFDEHSQDLVVHSCLLYTSPSPRD